MQVIKTWNYLRGYVIIKVEGLTLERFLNLAATQDIYLWDIKRLDDLTLEAKVSIEGFKSLKKIVKRVGCKIELIEKEGLPFVLYRLKERKMLGFGLVIFLALIVFLSSFIWSFDIIGNERVETHDIIEKLKAQDIGTGRFKYSIDKDQVRNFLLDEFDSFSFLSVEIKGTKLIIEVTEQDLIPEKVDIDSPCNIIANKKGVIVKTIARNGNSVVKQGDIVNEGEILITGIVSNEDSEEDIYVHADGEVLAKTMYSHTLEEAIVQSVKEETGRVYKRSELKIGKKSIQFYKGEIPFKDYIEEIEEVKPFGLDISLPLKLLVYEYKEVNIKDVKQNIEFLKESIYIKAIQQLNKELPKDIEIVSKDVKYYPEEDILTIQITLDVIEEIGEKKMLNN